MSRIFIYRRKPSVSAVALAAKLREDGYWAKKVSRIPNLRVDDKLICYGSYAGRCGVNDGALFDKMDELDLMMADEVPIVDFRDSLDEIPSDDHDWLRRSRNHSQAQDLLYGTHGQLDYWVRKENFVREFRIHIWNGVSIRAGMKFPDGPDSHPWIRSAHSGWTIKYNEECQYHMRQRYRDAAKDAVEALGLTFGAVDIGITEDGRHLVLEVNRAPGLSGRTLEIYAKKVEEMVDGN